MRTAKSAGGSARTAQAAGCAHESLARGRALHVQRCTHCNTLSLHFGAVTLRFDAESAEAVWATLGEALLVLHARRQSEEDEEPTFSPLAGRALGARERDGVN